MVFDHLVLVSCPIFNQHHKLNVDDGAAKYNLSGEAFSVCFHSTLIKRKKQSVNVARMKAIMWIKGSTFIFFNQIEIIFFHFIWCPT